MRDLSCVYSLKISNWSVILFHLMCVTFYWFFRCWWRRQIEFRCLFNQTQSDWAYSFYFLLEKNRIFRLVSKPTEPYFQQETESSFPAWSIILPCYEIPSIWIENIRQVYARSRREAKRVVFLYYDRRFVFVLTQEVCSSLAAKEMIKINK